MHLVLSVTEDLFIFHSLCDFSWVLYERINDRETKRKQKLDVKRKPNKWSGRTTHGLVTG